MIRSDRSPLAPAAGVHGPSAVARHPEFDALRAGAILLVVTLHAALAYTSIDVPRLLWAVRDPSPWLGFDLFCWWAMGVSVPLFFAVSGFFAARTIAARGVAGFVRGRLRRVVVPFLVASAVVLPPTFLAWAFGWYTSGRCTDREICRMVFLDPKIASAMYGPAHLWFSEYLIVMLAGLAAAWALRGARPERQAAPGPEAGRWLLAGGAPLVLAIPTAVLLKLGHDANGVDLSLDRHNSFLIDPIRLAHYAAFFAFGVGLHRAGARLDALAGRGRAYLLATLPVFAARAWLLRRDLAGGLDGPSSLALAGLGGLFAWLTLFGLIGVARRHLVAPSTVVRALADRSYWIYLVHFPIIGLAQADLFALPIPSAAKFAVTWGVTLSLCLATYRLVARRPVAGQGPGHGGHPSPGGPHRAPRGLGRTGGPARGHVATAEPAPGQG